MRKILRSRTGIREKFYFSFLVGALLWTCAPTTVMATNSVVEDSVKKENGFLSLVSDLDQYQVGDRAVVLATVNYSPSNPSQELVVRYSLDGEEVDFYRVSGQQFLGFPRLNSAGSKNIVVKLYAQNNHRVEAIEEKIAFVDSDIGFFLQRKKVEKDPETLKQIDAKIEELEVHRAALLVSISNERALLENRLFPLEVLPGSFVMEPSGRQLPASIFQLWAETNSVTVGQRAKFFALPLSDFFHPEGPYELVWRSSFLGDTLLARKVGENFEFLSSPLLLQHLGPQTFQLQLDLRLKKQGDFLRNSLTQIQKRIRVFEERRKLENRKTFWDWKIAQLQTGKNLLLDRFNSTLPVATQSVSITVVPEAL